MNFSDEVKLITTVKCQKTSNGFPSEERYTTTVFANQKSVGRAEFYSAMQVGIKQSIAFDVWRADFEEAAHFGQNGKKHLPSRVEYNGTEYNIVRTYTKDGETLELNCSEAEA